MKFNEQKKINEDCLKKKNEYTKKTKILEDKIKKV